MDDSEYSARSVHRHAYLKMVSYVPCRLGAHLAGLEPDAKPQTSASGRPVTFGAHLRNSCILETWAIMIACPICGQLIRASCIRV